MSNYTATIRWHNSEGSTFLNNRYSRGHIWEFDGGITVPASSSPQVVPLPMSVESAIDPEEAFIASVSSCHMLWFLSLAAKRGYIIETYIDQARGTMSKTAEGKLAITVITLFPEAIFSGEKMPTRSEIENLHHAAHESCFIANSVKTEIRCEPQFK